MLDIAFLAGSDQVVFLIVQPDTHWVLGDAVVGEGLQEKDTLVDHYLVFLVLVILVLEVVAGELLDGQVGGADYTLLAQDVRGLGHAPVGDVVCVLFIPLHCCRYVCGY